MDCNEVITNQINEERRLAELDNQLSDLTEKYKNLIKKIPYTDILEKYGENISDNLDDNFSRIREIYLIDRNKFNSIISEFNKYPEYKESERILNLRDDMKYKYFQQLIKYIEIINNDRKSLFSNEYNKRMNFLADKGYFIFHYQFPDEYITKIEDDKLEDYLIELYTQNNCNLIRYVFSEIFELKTFDTKLQSDKINDLKEAVNCFINKSYNSCARTMFALLENEHYKASEFTGIVSGKERSNKITDFIKRLNIEYYVNMWDKMNKYYKQCNSSTKNQNNNLNRNDLMHGGYMYNATNKDCLKLILLYINMKIIRYILNNFNLFLEEITQDAKLYKFIVTKEN